MAIKKASYTLPIIIILVIAAVAGALAIGGSKEKSKAGSSINANAINTSCGTYRKDGSMTINGHQINIEIAYSAKEKTTGLAGRPCIEPNWGMLFDLGRDGQHAFWMKGMKFPIDIIWINSAHYIATFEDNIEPSTYYSKNPFFENDAQHPARYVLEIKGGQSKELGLDLGTQIHFQKS